MDGRRELREEFEFDLDRPRTRMSDEEVLEALRRHARSTRAPLSAKGFDSGCGVSLPTLARRFGSFAAACDAAGLDAAHLRRPVSDEDLLEGFERLCLRRKRLGLSPVPALGDFEAYPPKQGRRISSVTFAKRFGRYPAFLRAYRLYHRGEISREVLIERCKASANPPRPQTPARPRITPRLRIETLRRFAYRCQACGRAAADLEPGETLEIDHITPVARGGGGEPENLTVKCRTCNRGKGARFVG